MSCSQPHENLTVRFCPLCGENLEINRFVCTDGHALKPGQKFCGICGSEAANKTSSKSRPPTPIRQSSSTINESYIPPKTFESAPREIDLLGTPGAFPDYPVRKQFGSSTQKSVIGLISGLLILVFVILMAGNLAKAEPVTVTVEMTISDENCWNLSFGYGDIPSGQVIVTVDGESAGFGSYSSVGTTTYLGCKFTAYVNDVPSDGENYSISMASGRRGTIYNTRAELIDNDWTFSLSLN